MKLNCVVLIADGTPDCTNEAIQTLDEVTFDNPVEVTVNFDRTIPPVGRAVLRKDGNQLVADIDLFESALKERGSFVGYTPAIGGTIDTLKPSPVDGVTNLTGVKIREVTLSENSNSDSRIKPLWASDPSA